MSHALEGGEFIVESGDSWHVAMHVLFGGFVFCCASAPGGKVVSRHEIRLYDL